jgi:hypothetical protein
VEDTQHYPNTAREVERVRETKERQRAKKRKETERYLNVRGRYISI